MLGNLLAHIHASSEHFPSTTRVTDTDSWTRLLARGSSVKKRPASGGVICVEVRHRNLNVISAEAQE